MSEALKVVCKDCDWRGDYSYSAITITGCPRCKAVRSMRTACDEPACWQEDTCGTPTPTGYRRTCGEHMPKMNDVTLEDFREQVLSLHSQLVRGCGNHGCRIRPVTGQGTNNVCQCSPKRFAKRLLDLAEIAEGMGNDWRKDHK